jgi:hypothetical protein
MCEPYYAKGNSRVLFEGSFTVNLVVSIDKAMLEKIVHQITPLQLSAGLLAFTATPTLRHFVS